jgi:hypothetical protein
VTLRHDDQWDETLLKEAVGENDEADDRDAADCDEALLLSHGLPNEVVAALMRLSVGVALQHCSDIARLSSSNDRRRWVPHG